MPSPDPAMAPSQSLSVVIPTLEAAATLPACLAALEEGKGRGDLPLGEVIVADGGSADGTAQLAARLGARVLSVAPGRGAQLAAGAAQARGDWLLFLHADTRLAEGWAGAAARFCAAAANRRHAAAFRLALDDGAPAARRVEALAYWRCRLWGLAYGDQGLLISRPFYDEVGGFRALALMEDVDLVRRVGRERLTLLEVPAVTSAARYRAGGYWLRPLRNLACLWLYFLRVPPRLIARLYR